MKSTFQKVYAHPTVQKMIKMWELSFRSLDRIGLQEMAGEKKILNL